MGRLNERAFPLVRAARDVDNRASACARRCGGLAWCVVERPPDAGRPACCLSCDGDGSVGDVLGEGRCFLEGLIDAGRCVRWPQRDGGDGAEDEADEQKSGENALAERPVFDVWAEALGGFAGLGFWGC